MGNKGEYILRTAALNCLEGKIELNPDDMPALKEYLKGVNKRINELPSVYPRKLDDELEDEILDILQKYFDCGNTYGYEVTDEIMEKLRGTDK